MKKHNGLFITLCFVSFFILAGTYSNHFHNAFQFDDSHAITDNAYIRDIKNIPLFFKDNKTSSSLPANQGYRPVTTASTAIDYWLGSGFDSTFYFHLSTYIWYVVQCVLMYFLYLKIFNNARQHAWNRYIALFAVTWYGVHTVNAETINYIIQRAEVLSTCMVVAGLVTYAYLPKWRKYYLYLVPVVVGIFAKEPAAMFAPLFFLYIMFFEKNHSAPAIFRPRNFVIGMKESLVAFIICTVFLYFVVNMVSMQPWSLYGASRSQYLVTQPFIIVHYFISFFFPYNLSADGDWQLIPNIFDIRVIAGVLFILAMLYGAYIASRKQETRPIAFGILWFFLALIPSSSVIPLAEVMNDHRMFFPFVGLMLSVVWTLGLMLTKNENIILNNSIVRSLIIVFALGILGGHAYGTYQRNKVWHTGESLWCDVAKKSPGNGRGLMNYGLTQMEKGNYQKAQEYFEKALILTPYYSTLHVNLGILKGAMNKPVEAERYFKNGIQYGPNDPDPYFFYARWLERQNRTAEAVPLLEKARQLSRAYVNAQRLLDEIDRKKTITSPLKQGEEAAMGKLTPAYYLNLSLQHHNAGRFSDSITACQKALKIQPDYYLAYNNICAAYNEMKIWDKAIEACEKGLKIKSDFQLMKNNLAHAKTQKALQHNK
jgi:protein O-mannosyl-transferase